MGKYNEQPTSGKGGDFRVEQNTRYTREAEGTAADLSRFGSLAECVECVISAGAYISFGRTTDGGATLIRVLDGDDKLSSYCHSHAEVLEAMEALRLRYRRPTALVKPDGKPKDATAS